MSRLGPAWSNRNFQVAGINHLWGRIFGRKGFDQMAQVHVSSDGFVFKGLQQELNKYCQNIINKILVT